MPEPTGRGMQGTLDLGERLGNWLGAKYAKYVSDENKQRMAQKAQELMTARDRAQQAVDQSPTVQRAVQMAPYVVRQGFGVPEPPPTEYEKLQKELTDKKESLDYAKSKVDIDELRKRLQAQGKK